MEANAKVDFMNNHPIQYGPSLRRIADKYFPGAAGADSSLLDTALVSGSITPTHKERAWAMSNHVRSVSKPASASGLVAGDIVLFKAFNSLGQRGLEPLVLGGESPFLLDTPCPTLGPHAWNAWVVSGYTAYATNWDVFVPWDDVQWPYDPAACVVHANRRVVLHVDMANTVSVRVSPTCLASVRAVSDEFLQAAATGTVRASAVKVTDLGERVTLGGLRVRTGEAIDRDDDPRLVLSRMLLTLTTELNDFAQAWARAAQRSFVETCLISRLAAGVATIGRSLLGVVAEAGLPEVRARAAASGDMARLQLGNEYVDVEWNEKHQSIELRPSRFDSSPVLFGVEDRSSGAPIMLIDETGASVHLIELTTTKRTVRIANIAYVEPVFTLLLPSKSSD